MDKRSTKKNYIFVIKIMSIIFIISTLIYYMYNIPENKDDGSKNYTDTNHIGLSIFIGLLITGLIYIIFIDPDNLFRFIHMILYY